MPKIVITEIDETTPGVVSESTDVVYIPGFVNVEQECLYDNSNYIGLPLNTPTLFTSVNAFETLCGTEPAVFGSDQRYDALKTRTVTIFNAESKEYETIEYTNCGFSENSVPYHGVMFNKGDPDPAYVMAKELLASGISVMYERINSGDVYEELDGTPNDFTTNYKNYYFYVEPGNTISISAGYSALSDKYKDAAPVFEPNVYFKKDPTLGTYSYVTEIPEGTPWEEFYKQCYYQEFITLKEGYHSCFNGDPSASIHKTLYKLNTANNFVNIKTVYDALEEVYDSSNELGIVDRGNFNVKYLTSGGYPAFEYTSSNDSKNTLVTKMLNMAEKRGDCVALIDHTDYIGRVINSNDDKSVYKSVVKGSEEGSLWANGDFGAMFTPWATYNRITTDTLEDGTSGTTTLRAPASFAYLTSLSDSIKTNANWLAIAGVTRGGVLNIGNMTTIIPNTVADAMQPRQGMSINAITNIRPYGNVIWGNRTLKHNAENLVATSFLNIRNLVSDVKKTCYRVARSTTFEQDTDVLWMNFKNSIASTLDRMVSGYGISGYKIVRDNTHYRAKEKATICARIILYPTYAVEDFYITVVLKDAEVTVE